jgi:hypothetical protein
MVFFSYIVQRKTVECSYSNLSEGEASLSFSMTYMMVYPVKRLNRTSLIGWLLIGLLCALMVKVPLVAAATMFVEGFNELETPTGAGRYSKEWYALACTPTSTYDLIRVEVMAGGGSGTFMLQLAS